METSNIKSYAPKARLEFMDAVAKRLNTFGISINKKGELQVTEAIIQGSVLQISDNNFDSKLAPARQRLVQKSEQLGYAQLVEQVAYTWFNRLCAIRYMEIHGYLGHGFRVLSHPNGDKRFEILDHAQDAAEDLGLDRDRIIDLMLAGDKNEELYRELLLGQCHKLHEAMPFLFESLNDETELLLPDNLTRTDSILRGLVDGIPEEDWQQVEVIGWLYQFYISEKKDQVIGKVVKTEDIPAATQLFTPNWIVKYMVQNSLGAQWLATYPESPLKAQMEYYIEPAEQTDEVNAQLKAITPESLNPEELTLIDPASGSGHILVEAYDLFKAIYLERGYRQRDIAQLVLEKNLFGLDIDQRAAQLTGFALMMKGREDDRRLFERGVKLNVMAMVDSTNLDVDTLVHGVDLAQQNLTAEDLTTLKDLFEHATTFGSLIQVPQNLAEKLQALKQLSETNSQDMFVKEVLEHLAPLVMQAEILIAEYDVVVANPPYMGGSGMNSLVKQFSKDYFPKSKSDLFAVSTERFMLFAKQFGFVGLMTPFTWMFLKSYEALRNLVTENMTIRSLIQPEYHAFFESAYVPICTFIIRVCYTKNYEASFIRLVDFYGAELQPKKTLEAIENPECEWFYRAKPDDFRKVPGSPLAYWVSDSIRNIFQESNSLSTVAAPRQGLITGDNERFLRYWHEVSAVKTAFSYADNLKFYPHNKGGEYRKWFGNQEYLINWENDGSEIKSFTDEKGKVRSRPQNLGHNFSEHISWSLITSGDFSARFYDSSFSFNVAGISCFPSSGDIHFLLSFLNTKIVNYLTKIINPTLNSNVGDVGILPVIDVCFDVSTLAKSCCDISKKDWDAYERSWYFQSYPLLSSTSESTPTLESSYDAWISENQAIIAEMQRLEEENNRLFIDAYGLQDELTPEVPIEQITLTVNPAYRYGIKGTEKERNARFRADTMTELVSYTIGCMMGRYSLDQEGLVYAHAGNEGFDTSLYKTFPADSDGIVTIMDDEWFKGDACNRVIEFVKTVWGEDNLTENLQFIADSLCLDAITPRKSETAVETIRRYLSTKFYKDHMQTYKKRPIYWLFSSGKEKAFECLVYLHRYNESTLSRMRTEYVTPLLGKYQAYAEQLDKQIDMAESTQDKKRLERELKSMDKKQSELREFDDKLKHYADMRISIDLDDGVKENYGKFGDLLAEVKKITGEKPEMINAN